MLFKCYVLFTLLSIYIDSHQALDIDHSTHCISYIHAWFQKEQSIVTSQHCC